MAFDKKTAIRDICLVLALLSLGIILLLVIRPSEDAGNFAVVEVDGRKVARYSLSEDGVFEINGGRNTIEVKGGKVRMLESDCPNQLCVHQMWIDRVNQSIICLPNRVIVTIAGPDGSVDFVL